MTRALAPIPNKLRPWEDQPYKLLSWWDMERFSAAAFQHLVISLVFLADQTSNLPPDLESGDLVEKVREECEKIHVRVSIACADDFIALAEGMTAKDLSEQLRQLESTVRRKMQSCVFSTSTERESTAMPNGICLGLKWPQSSLTCSTT